MVNELPHPQVDVAFGFLIVNPPPVTVSTKSTSAPFRYRMLIGIDEELHAVRLVHLIAGALAVLLDHQPVLEARTAAALHEHAQAAAALVLFSQKLGDLASPPFRTR